ncbi:MAG: hypothetical protein ACREQV_01810 [Candidatus Binatia bacterium]
MSRLKHIWKYGAIAGCLGAVLYASAYFYTVRSEAFQYAKSWIVESKEYEHVVGRVIEARVDPWGGFSHHFSGIDRDASIVVVVVGEAGSVRIDLDLQKRSNEWKVVSATVSD